MRYSRNQINKAGNIILTSKDQNEVSEALVIVNDWRSDHLQPLNTLKDQVSNILCQNRIKPYLISQRLKRLTSIQYKLDLNPEMRLGGMQDIGGLRAVLKDTQDLSKSLELIKDNIKDHELVKISDYVNNPKDSGYRSIHLMYKFKSEIPEYNDLRLELQLRTKLQHNWATAVETAGLLNKTSLKSNQGSDEWLNFFKIVSSLFAIKEQMPVLAEHKHYTIEELMVQCFNYEKQLQVSDLFKAITVSVNHIENLNYKGDYYILNIDLEKRIVAVNAYDDSEIATDAYVNMEKNIQDNKNAVVLVSASSIKSLREAYPSFFLDTSEFINALEKIKSNCKMLNLV